MPGIVGMNAETGKPLDGMDHLIQSIRDILTTPIGTRVMLREYGSSLPDLIDRPMNRFLRIEIYVAVIDALERWEPRFRITRVQVAEAIAGAMTLDLAGVYLPEGDEVTLEGIVI